MNKFKDTDYLNISMRIKYLEARLMGAEAFDRVVFSKTPNDAMSVVCECLGIGTDRSLSAFDFETVIEQEEKKVSDFLLKNAPDRTLVELFAMRRDFMNVKALIKADICNVSPDTMLVNGGTLDKNEIKKAFVKRDEKLLNGYFIAAVRSAYEIYAQTGDPQRIDTVCDRICFECINNTASASDFAFVADFFRTRIDIINILSFIRQKLIGKSAEFFSSAVIPGGRLFSQTDLSGAYTEPLSDFIDKLTHTEYSALISDFDVSSPNPAILEKNADRLVCSKIKNFEKTAFGPQVIVGYILAKEYEAKNIRIAMSGVLSGQSGNDIKERLRLGYE